VWEESPLICPSCRKPLRKGQYSYSSGILIDRCDACGGIWLDRGELGKIRAFIHQGVPKEKLLMAQLQAETLRTRMEAKERREEILGGLGQGSPGGPWVGWREVLSFLKDLVLGSWR
jgi:Zn-finger nucleic acid-binding protein